MTNKDGMAQDAQERPGAAGTDRSLPRITLDDQKVPQAKRVRLPARVIDACPHCGEVVERDMADVALYYPEANGPASVNFYHLHGDDEHEWSVPVILRMSLELVPDAPRGQWPTDWPTPVTLADPMARFMRFAAETFPQATGRSTLVHLQREIAELLAAVDADDVAAIRAEVPDVVVLALQVGMRLLGHDLASALDDKLATNRARSWGAPDSDGVVEHVRA